MQEDMPLLPLPEPQTTILPGAEPSTLTQSAHRFVVPLDESHRSLLIIAALEGCNVAPAIEGDRFIGFGNAKNGFGPVCIVDVKETPFVAEPHVTWFPWTPAKERIAAFKWAMEYYGQEKEVLLIVAKPSYNLHEHFVKRGLLRKIGFIDHMPEGTEQIHMYQYNRGRK